MAQVGELPVKVLLTCAEVGRTTAVGRTISRLTLELKRLSAVVIVAQSARDAISVLVTDPDVHVAVVDWDLCEDEIAAGELLERLRRQADDLPLFLMVERGGVDQVPVASVRRCDGFVYPLDDTADWIAGRIHDAGSAIWRAHAPPMFAGLVDFAVSNTSTPGTPPVTRAAQRSPWAPAIPCRAFTTPSGRR